MAEATNACSLELTTEGALWAPGSVLRSRRLETDQGHLMAGRPTARVSDTEKGGARAPAAGIGVGSTFRFTLPFAKSVEARPIEDKP